MPKQKPHSPVSDMPEDWQLSDANREYACRKGMTLETMEHEFERCKNHHAENQWTEKGWKFLVWERWVLNWMSYGSKQLQADVWG